MILSLLVLFTADVFTVAIFSYLVDIFTMDFFYRRRYRYFLSPLGQDILQWRQSCSLARFIVIGD